MKGLPFVLLFTAMTFVAWGAYGPTLHHGATALHHDSLRAFVGVGLAYFLIAVIIPFMILKRSGEAGKWTISGTFYSLVAGGVGAIGALGILLALGYGGSPIYVMPLVFGFAPVVNTLVTAFLSRTFDQISPIFIAGVIAAALGAVGVLTFKPGPGKAPQAVDRVQPHITQTALRASQSEVDEKPPAPVKEAAVVEPEKEPSLPAAKAETTAAADRGRATDVAPVTETVVGGGEQQSQKRGAASERSDAKVEHAAAGPAMAQVKKSVDFWGVLGSIVIAAICWGSYGPMLHIGQGKMSGSRLRPFACVGIAYFLIAVAAPLVLIYSRSADEGAWTALGMGWSFVAGVAGAIGALGVILAFNAGGKPYYVMPLIFGFAPVINTFISVSEAGTWEFVPPMFWVSLAVVIAGAVTVLINAPKPRPHKAT